MPKFKVFWTEKHSVWVQAPDSTIAADKALRMYPQAESCDWQTIDDVEVATYEELASEKADREEGRDE